MASKPHEMYMESARVVAGKNGKNFVAYTMRNRSDVQQDKDGLYAVSNRDKSGKTDAKNKPIYYHDSPVTIKRFNTLMKQTGNDLQVPEDAKPGQLVGKDTPDKKVPLMNARTQGFKIVKGKGRQLAYGKDVEFSSVVAGTAEKSAHPEFSRDKNAQLRQEHRKEAREKAAAGKDKQADKAASKDKEPEPE